MPTSSRCRSSLFIANTTDNRDFLSDFGPSGLDRRHNLTISASVGLIGGFRWDQISARTGIPQSTLAKIRKAAVDDGRAIKEPNGRVTWRHPSRRGPPLRDLE